MIFEDRIQENPRLLRLKNTNNDEVIDFEIQDLLPEEIIQEGTEIGAEELNGQIVNENSESESNCYSANYINKMFDFSDSYNYSGSVMSSTNGSVQSYSSITIHVNKLGTMAYAEGTLYNNHSTARSCRCNI